MDITFVTGNTNKVKEVESILGIPLKGKKLDLDEIQNIDVEVVARKKAQSAFDIIKTPLIVDDAGLYVKAWKGFPGAYVKHVHDYATLERLEKWIQLENNSKVKVIAVVAFHDGTKIHTFQGEVDGEFVSPRGDGGWGFDKFILPKGSKQTWGEMTTDEKNKSSHRNRALLKFKTFLVKNNYI